MRLIRIIVAGGLIAALLAFAPAAFAQSSAQNGYSAPGGVVQTQLNNSGPSSSNSQAAPAAQSSAPAATTTTRSSGKLPFTGLDIALIVAAGGVLLAMGFGIRRLSRAADIA
jgi:hypothetical protein